MDKNKVKKTIMLLIEDDEFMLLFFVGLIISFMFLFISVKTTLIISSALFLAFSPAFIIKYLSYNKEEKTPEEMYWESLFVRLEKEYTESK